ncbi:MAG TPA: ABC transporter permease [Anaerolineales bacterium]|jgi:ABC-2 type transport system permease protein|nr:ABC transporter permease [Anaerolineales bacterium]
METSLTGSLAKPGFRSDLRALFTVMWREWIIFTRYPSWIIAMFIWPLIFPMLYILTARALAGPDGRGMAVFMETTGATDFIGYIVIGTTVWMWQNIVLWDVGFSLRNEQMRGTLESNWLSPTWRFSYLLGHTGPQFITMLMFITITAIEFGLLFGIRLNGSIWMILLMMLAAVPSIYGLGFAFASLVITVKEANAFVFLIRGLVMIFCGITFPISLLPDWMQSIAKWLPQTYLIHGMRAAAFSKAGIGELAPDFIPLLLFGTCWLVVGYFTFLWMERRARRTGAIGQY